MSFDDVYYHRFYENPDTRVTSEEETERLVRFVLSYLDYVGLDVRRVVDFGAGVGMWRDAISRVRTVLGQSQCEYVGVDVSEAACRQYGWEQGSVSSYKPKGKYDLVVCCGVLQYVPEEEVGNAVANLAACCRGAVYLQLLTRKDWKQVADQRRTDRDVYLRKGAFYRRYLARHFSAIGGGLFVPKDSTLPLWEMEYLE